MRQKREHDMTHSLKNLRLFLQITTSLVLALILGRESIAAAKNGKDAATSSLPNIVLIMADDLGYGEVGCFGQKVIKTPNIDRLASEGMRLTQFYSGAPVCAPARCVLMTGLHSGHAYIRTNREVKPEGQLPIPGDTVTVAKLLKERGYKTAAIGKWGLGMFGSSGDPNKQGFDLFYGFNCQRHAHNHYPRYLWRNDKRETLEGNDRTLTGKQYSQDLFAREALRFIRENKDDPFFLYLPFAIPHLSIQVPDESLDEYKGKIPEEDYKHRGYLKHPVPRAGYAAMVSHMDRDIGKVLNLLKELDIDDETIVLFTSDNGPTFDRLGGSDSDFFHSSGPLRGRKGSVYEGGIRVPLVVRWPGQVKAGTTSDHVAAFWDLLPTLCDVAGMKAPEAIDGQSIAPTLLAQGTQTKHEYLYWEFPSYGGQQAIRLGDFKGVRQNMSKGKMEIELYDLKQDLGEQNNVAGRHPDVVARIEEIMRTARTPSKQFPFKQLD